MSWGFLLLWMHVGSSGAPETPRLRCMAEAAMWPLHMLCAHRARDASRQTNVQTCSKLAGWELE